jgi:hypothetical protein
MAGAKEMVRDPEFQALPWAERHQLLAMKDPDYAALSPGDQSGVMNALKTKDYWKPGAAPAEPSKDGDKPSIRKRVADFVRPTLEGLGTIAGETLGAPFAIPSGGTSLAALGGLGFAAGSGVADVIEGKPTSFKDMVTDVRDGATAVTGGRLVGSAVGAAIRKAPAVISAVKSPVQTRASGRASQTLSSLNELSPQEAANAANAQALANKLGVKLTPAQMSGKPSLSAMEQGLATADPEFAGVLNAQDSATKQAALDGIRRSVGKGKPLPATQDLATTGQNIADTIGDASLPAKKAVSDMYDAIPNNALPTKNTASTIKELESSFRPGDEDVFPSRAITRIKEALQGPKPKAGGHGKPADPVVLDAYGQPMRESVDTTKSQVGFQDLHSLRKDIGRQIQDASSGANPNRELAMKLRKIKDAIDADIEAGMGKDNGYVAAKDAFKEYANKYRSGAVNKVLTKGNEASGLRTADENIARQFYTPSGSNGLIKAVGLAAAKDQMRPFVIADMLKAAAPDGVNYNVQTGVNYIQKNRAVLERFRLVDEARQVLKDQFPVEMERTLAKRAPDPVTGAQFFSSQDMRSLLQKHGNTIKQLYGAETLESFRDYNRLMSMIERKNVVPRGGNSNTAEKAMNMANLMVKESVGPARKLTDGLLMAIVKGGTLGGGATMAAGNLSPEVAAIGATLNGARQLLQNADSQVAKAFVKILQDATVNPQVARDLMRIQRTGKVPPSLQAVIDKNMLGATAATLTE